MEYNLEITGKGSLKDIITSLEVTLKAINGLKAAGEKVGTDDLAATFDDSVLKTKITKVK